MTEGKKVKNMKNDVDLATYNMTPIQRKIQRDKKLVKKYIEEHPELKELASILEKMAETENGVRLSVSIGKRINDYTFGSHLSSYTKNPRIRFEMIRDKEHIKSNVPIVSISDSKNGKPVTLICLSDMSNIKIKTEDCTKCAFDRYSIRFTLIKPIGRLDYDMGIVIDRQIEKLK